MCARLSRSTVEFATCCFVFQNAGVHLSLEKPAGVSEPYNVRARENEDTAVLAIGKNAFNEVISAYPEQNDIIMTNMLLQYGLTRDGDDTGGGAAAQGEDDALSLIHI